MQIDRLMTGMYAADADLIKQPWERWTSFKLKLGSFHKNNTQIKSPRPLSEKNIVPIKALTTHCDQPFGPNLRERVAFCKRNWPGS